MNLNITRVTNELYYLVAVEVVAMATVMAAVIEIGADAARHVVGPDRVDGAVGPARDQGQ